MVLASFGVKVGNWPPLDKNEELPVELGQGLSTIVCFVFLVKELLRAAISSLSGCSGCLRSAEAPGVFLIRNKAGSHYWASMLSSLLIVSDGNRGGTEPWWSD